MRRVTRRLASRRLLVSMAVVSALVLTACTAPVKGGAPGPRCAPVSINGWNHYETQFTSGFRPAANWPVVDNNNATDVSSPTGSAKTVLAFAPNFNGMFQTPNDVLNFLSGPGGGITNIQVVATGGPYPLSNGTAQDYEITGINNGELLNIGTPIRAFVTALVVQNTYIAWWFQGSYADIFEGVCGTLASIRQAMFRKTQPPAGGF